MVPLPSTLILGHPGSQKWWANRAICSGDNPKTQQKLDRVDLDTTMQFLCTATIHLPIILLEPGDYPYHATSAWCRMQND
ncbi:MAG TPA: hypothetical protein VLH38_05705 [Patescibacteria group bacterium]|nr:hypothetical protein [Patescibacteria group bacterium]